MRVSGRVLAILLFVFIVAELVILIPKTESTRENIAPRSTSQAETVAEQWMKGAQVIETQAGRKKWEMKAEEASGIRSQETWRLRKVQTIFFDEGNRESFRMRGNEGSVDGKTKDMEVTGAVTLDSASGYRIQTEKATYNSQDGTLRGEDPVLMKSLRQENIEIRGIGFRGTVKGSHVDILKDVIVRRFLKDGKTLNVHSNQARFSGKDHSANFSGDVVLDFGSSRVQGPEARFVYDPKTDEIEIVEVEGGVRLSDLDKWATAQKFRMNLKKDEFSLRGNPRLVQEKDELRGEEIIFFDNGRRVQVRGAKADLDSQTGGGRM